MNLSAPDHLPDPMYPCSAECEDFHYSEDMYWTGDEWRCESCIEFFELKQGICLEKVQKIDLTEKEPTP